jgi:hypothetical protein
MFIRSISSLIKGLADRSEQARDSIGRPPCTRLLVSIVLSNTLFTITRCIPSAYQHSLLLGTSNLIMVGQLRMGQQQDTTVSIVMNTLIPSYHLEVIVLSFPRVPVTLP